MTRFGALEELRSRPIGDLAAARAARKDFRTAIPIRRDNAYFGEVLVEARDQGLQGINFYASDRNPPYWQHIEGATDKLLLRASVAEKLQNVNRRTASAGLELFLFDAWRPRAVQAYFHDVWMPQELKRRDPVLVRARVSQKRWSVTGPRPARTRIRPRRMPPAPRSISPCAGRTARRFGWVRCSTMSPRLPPATGSNRLPLDNFSFSDQEARANRRLLHWLMVEEGFAGHPEEWWHFSWGDQMWAALTGAQAAHYGLARD